MGSPHVEVRTVKRYFVGGKGYGSSRKAYKEAAKLAIKERVLGPIVRVEDAMFGEYGYDVREKLRGCDDMKATAFALYAKAFPHDSDCFVSPYYSEPPPCHGEDEDGMCRRRYCYAVELLAKEMRAKDEDALAKQETKR